MVVDTVGLKLCFVYWLLDEKCVCLWRHGYIGITDAVARRVRRHRWSRKFPSEFTCQILFAGTRAECRALEYKLRPDRNIGWNFLPGGGKSPRAGVKISEELRQRMSEAGKRRAMLHPLSQEAREKIRIANTGRTNKGRIGQQKSDEERRKISLSQIGKRVSEETRRKQSLRKIGTAFHRGHLHTEETKQTIRIKKTGVSVHSKEHKRKLAERWQGNALTKGQPWSAARRLAWLQTKET